jgi:hypothetical protein
MENKKTSKKELKEMITQTLNISLEKLKEGMSEKSYTRNIKKAAKLLVADFKLAKTPKAKPAKKIKNAAQPEEGK